MSFKDLSMYLAHRGNTWHFSRRLPIDGPVPQGRVILLSDRSVRIGKNGYIRFSLETQDKREALRRSRRYAAEIDQAIATQAKQPILNQPVSDRELQRAARLMQASLLAADEVQYDEAMAATLAGEVISRPPDRETDLARQLPPATVTGDAQLLQQLRSLIPLYVLQATGKTLGGNLAEYGARLIPFVRAWRQTVAQLQERATGNAVPTPADPRREAAETVTLDWDELLTYYEQQHPDLAERTRALYRLSLRELASFAQCEPSELKRAQVIAWRDDLLLRLQAKTVLTRLTAAGSVYRYALDNEKLGERSNPFNRVSVAGAKSAESSRKGFEAATLKALFDPPPQLADIPASAGAHAALWIPLLALYTGARRSELAGLLADEAGQDDDGIWYLHFRNNALRTLKNGVSERHVPLHAKLVELGFPKYIEAVRSAGVKQLFPGIANPDSVGDWFSRYVSSRIGKGDVMQDLHSFRHTFKTATRNAAIIQEIHDAMTGHATPGIGAKYGDRAGLARIKAEIDKVSYPGLKLHAPVVPSCAELKRQEISARRRLAAGMRRQVKAQARSERAQNNKPRKPRSTRPRA